jgi:hypothetical protein
VKRIPLYVLALTTLCTTAARAQTLWYVLVPTTTPGVIETEVEMGRTDLSLSDVQMTYVPNGTSGLDATATNQQVFIGPSTSRPNPLLNISAADAGGMVILDPVPGLNAVEVSFQVDTSPIKTAWKLPLLTADQFFPANSTVYVLNLVKGTDAASNLQIFNPSNLGSTCTASVLRPKGTVIEERVGIKVPAVGVTLVSDILRKVAAVPSSGINVAVSCDAPFYAMGAYPATNRTETRVEYPVTKIPANLTSVELESRPGLFLNATSAGHADIQFPLAYDPTVNYHTTTIEFDGAVAAPQSFIVFWNIAGLFRKGGRRFDKTLFFGSFYNYGKAKYVVDVGTPFIETTLKYVFPLSPGHRYHFAITLDNDQQSNHYVITEAASGVPVMDLLVGLYNPVASDENGDQPTLEIGLNGIADNAYFPPVGWRFSNLSVVATK